MEETRSASFSAKTNILWTSLDEGLKSSILPTQAKLGRIPANVTLNIGLFILVIHFDHFLLGYNNVNSCLKLKHGFSSQISGLAYNFCQLNKLWGFSVIKYGEFEYLQQRASTTLENLETSLKVNGVLKYF